MLPDIKTLYPMDMEEFLLAVGKEDLVERIKKCFADNMPIPSPLHDMEMQLYRQYLIVGGMPECVMQRNGKLIPVEVKSADNTKAKSLKVYMESYQPDYAIKLSAKNFAFEDGKKADVR